MKDLLYKFLYNGDVVISPSTIITRMALALILGLILFTTYKITFSGVSYNKKFNVTLVMLTLTTTMVMNIIGSSVSLSLGMVGALSIVRFRTAIKDPRDTGYIFWAICIGLGMGTSNYSIVVIGTILLSIVSILFSTTLKNDDSYLIIIRAQKRSADEVRSKLFSLYRACKLRSEIINTDGIEIVYQVKMGKKNNIKGYEEINKISGVSSINIIAQNGETLG